MHKTRLGPHPSNVKKNRAYAQKHTEPYLDQGGRPTPLHILLLRGGNYVSSPAVIDNTESAYDMSMEAAIPECFTQVNCLKLCCFYIYKAGQSSIVCYSFTDL